MKPLIPLLLLLSACLLLSPVLSDRTSSESGRERCMRECQEQPRYDKRMTRRCEEECRREYGRGREGEEHHRRIAPREEPERRLERCMESCRAGATGQSRGICERRCAMRYQEERGYVEEDNTGRQSEEEQERRRQIEEEIERQRRRGGNSYEAEIEEDSSRRQREEEQEERRTRQSEQEREDRRRGGNTEEEEDSRRRSEEERRESEERRRRGGNEEEEEVDSSEEERQEERRRRQSEQEREHRRRRGGNAEDENDEEDETSRSRSEEERQEERRRQSEQEESHRRRRRGGNAEDESDETSSRRRSEEERQEERRRQSEQEQSRRRSRRRNRYSSEEEEEEEEEGGGGEEFVYDKESFRRRVHTSHGQVQVHERFTSFSSLLRGIEKFRLGIIEANPNTFFLPHHLDAEAVLYVVHGRGKMNLLVQDSEKESHNIRKGDIFRVPAGTIMYLINNDNSETLQIAVLLKTISTPGQFKAFYGVGGENPESFYNVFSNDLLQAAFNTDADKIERLFTQQRKGAIVRATQQQLRGIGRSTGTRWPFGGGSETFNRPFNLLDKRPAHANRHGQLYEVDGEEYRQIHDLDLMVSFGNISAGSMSVPMYNSKSIKIALVVKGDGYVEMACPHKSSNRRESHREEEEEEEGRSQEEERVHYRKIRSHLSRGTAFVVLAGHPFITVSTGDENLEVICFEINAENNQKYFLAGKNNVLNLLEDEAKELSFNLSAKEVDEVLNAQRESVFVPGPEGGEGRRRRRGEEERRRRRSHPLSNIIMDFAGL